MRQGSRRRRWSLTRSAGFITPLARCDIELPDFRVGIQRARQALGDERRLADLAPCDRTFLREVFDALLPEIDTQVFESRALHGQPHDGNRILTPRGIRWIDFESVCRGPIEWDLAFLPEQARESFTEVDQDLLAILSLLNRARVATWCWIQARFPDMRWHGEHHLDLLRLAWPNQPGKREAAFPDDVRAGKNE